MTEAWAEIQSSFVKLIGNADIASINSRLMRFGKTSHIKIESWITDFLAG